jgi:hypothetical protein
MNSVKLVEDFCARVLTARNPNAVDWFVADGFSIRTNGSGVISLADAKRVVFPVLSRLDDFKFTLAEVFQNEDGSRVISHWRVQGNFNEAKSGPGRPTHLTCGGMTVWAFREDGKLLHSWIEQSTWEWLQRVHLRLNG